MALAMLVCMGRVGGLWQLRLLVGRAGSGWGAGGQPRLARPGWAPLVSVSHLASLATRGARDAGERVSGWGSVVAARQLY